MDLILAKTFLKVAETGSFIDAGRRMNVTQSTVSARIKTLEDLMGRPLFDRSRSGASLTSAGSQFQKHAVALMRIWSHAQLEVGIGGQHRDHLAVGAEGVLWDGFLLRWVAWLRVHVSDIAVSASAATPAQLVQRLAEGTLDLAVMYRPGQPPGLVVEHLFDEEFVLVASAQTKRGRAELISVDWGPAVQADPDSALPEFAHSGLALDLGPLTLSYLLAGAGAAYLPARIAKPHLARGRLRVSKKGRRFVVPVGMIYPEARDEEAYEPILAGLRAEAMRHAG